MILLLSYSSDGKIWSYLEWSDLQLTVCHWATSHHHSGDGLFYTLAFRGLRLELSRSLQSLTLTLLFVLPIYLPSALMRYVWAPWSLAWCHRCFLCRRRHESGSLAHPSISTPLNPVQNWTTQLASSLFYSLPPPPASASSYPPSKRLSLSSHRARPS